MDRLTSFSLRLRSTVLVFMVACHDFNLSEALRDRVWIIFSIYHDTCYVICVSYPVL